MQKTFNIPILFIIFNRPEATKKIFEKISEIKPKKLYIVADGPRKNIDADRDKCLITREVVNNINWDCEVKKLYRESNEGCKKSVSSAISWFFDNEEMGIIIEDDCLPSNSFFIFCEQMLIQYREDERIMMIAGSNYRKKWKNKIQDYHFSMMGGIWGWASWRRAWKFYDVNIKCLEMPGVKALLKGVFEENFQDRYKLYKSVYNNKIDTWDYQWNLTRILQSGLTIVPSLNLITNIGFGEEATHTKTLNKNANLEKNEIKTPVRLNPFVVIDKEYDKIFFENKNSILKLLTIIVKRLFV